MSPISLAVSSDGRTLTLNPFGPTTQKLAKRTTYKVTIKGGPGWATDVAGNPLNQPGPNAVDAEWTFKTGLK